MPYLPSDALKRNFGGLGVMVNCTVFRLHKMHHNASQHGHRANYTGLYEVRYNANQSVTEVLLVGVGSLRVL